MTFTQELVNIQRIVFAFLARDELAPEFQIKPTTANHLVSLTPENNQIKNGLTFSLPHSSDRFRPTPCCP